MRIRIISTLWMLANLVAIQQIPAATIFDPGQGPITLDSDSSVASELSGLVWLGGSEWAAVSDDTSTGAHAFRLTCEVDPATGHILATPTVSLTLDLAAGQDPEGITHDPTTNTLIVSDEVGPAVLLLDGTNGQLLESLVIPNVYTAGLRSNLGLESMTRSIDGTLWTANEEALTSDGDVSSFDTGSIVRLQRFNSDHLPAGQWGYITDPISADIFGSTPGRDVERSGVVDLAVLADGSLLALERMLGGSSANGFPVFRIRIYEINIEGADDTSALANLSLGNFLPVSKDLLWEASFDALGPQRNFEGMAVGPQLDNGAFTLLLISDDGSFGGASQTLYALQIVADSPIFADGFESGDTSEWSSTPRPSPNAPTS